MAEPAPPVLDDFVLVKVLGKGSYGKVMLVHHKDKKDELFAMKMLRKENVVKRNQVEHTKAERNVLEAVSHPFIVSLKYAFQTPKKLYFVLDYCAGGELFFHLSRAGRFTEARACFYTCELLLAIQYLHGLNIIYRDLKPENVLLSNTGHVKLTDFGLSKEGIEDNFSAKTMCGTPEYLAPEILDKKGHGKAVDWYSLGALVFEMLSGLPPFYTKDRTKLFERIRTAELQYPSHMSRGAVDLCRSLLKKDPAQRLGSGPDDGQEVRAHGYFGHVDWVAYMQCAMPPPFTPDLKSGGDIKYFEKEFVNQPVVNSEVGEVAGKNDTKFEGFTYHEGA